MKAQAEFIRWLRNAYAMEKAMELTLSQQRDDEKAPPIFREQAAQHCLETRRHAEMVAACLKKLGAVPAPLKTRSAQGMELLKNAGRGCVHDRHIKALLSACASEHYEIACYSALRACAKRLGFTGFVAQCDEIIREEQRMAQWLEEHLPKIVGAYLDCREMQKSPVQKARRLIDGMRAKAQRRRLQ